MQFKKTSIAMAALLGLVISAGAQAQDRDQDGNRGRAISRALSTLQAKMKAHAAKPTASSDDADDLDDDDELESSDVVQDGDGREHVRFQRRYKGLRVIGGDLVAHSDASGQLKAISRSWKRRAALDTNPAVSERSASATAAMRFPHQAPKVTSTEKVVWAVDGHDTVAWDVVVEGMQRDGTPSTLHTIIHAGTGKTLARWDDVHTTATTVTGNSQYSGTVTVSSDLSSGTYALKDASRGNHYVADANNKTDYNLFGILFPAKLTQVTSTSSTLGSGSTADRKTAAVDAAHGFEVTWDYYKQVHGRTGIDGAGRQVYSRVHYGSNYNNAFWTGTCFCMTYGDGDGSAMTALTAVDVSAHEMTHGVTASTAKLIYTGESGGLNEGISDIFGTMVEHYAANGVDQPDYLIGEKIVGPRITRGYLRTMINPSDDGASADCWYSGVGSLDVHLSSGVTNHVYYLMAEGTNAGSPSRTCQAGDSRVATGQGTVAGMGRQKAEKVWYRALTVYMTSSTNFAAARVATIKAATDLYGASSPEVASVAAAWSAVKVN